MRIEFVCRCQEDKRTPQYHLYIYNNQGVSPLLGGASEPLPPTTGIPLDYCICTDDIEASVCPLDNKFYSHLVIHNPVILFLFIYSFVVGVTF